MARPALSRRRDGHDPARRARVGPALRDGDEGLEVRVSRDNERAARVKDDVVRCEGGLHARVQRERLSKWVARIEADLAEGRGSDCYLCAIRRYRDAVREGDVWRDGGMGR